MSNTSSPGSLGNLAQSARSGQLRTARIIMFIVGGLTLLLNVATFSRAEREVDEAFQKEIEKIQAQGLAVDEAEVDELRARAVTLTKILSVAGVIIGIVFIVLGIVVYQIPVAATVLALVLYVGMNALVGFLEPTQLARGIIIKVLIVVGLFKSIQAAIAYKNERQ